MGKKKKAAAAYAREMKAARKADKAAKRKKNLLLAMTLAGGGTVAAAAAGAMLLKGKATPGSGKVELMDAEPNGISAMMAQLMQVYMAEPKKKAVADGMNVSIAIQDITAPDIATTLTFQGSDITVANGIAPDADIYIGTELGLLLSLSGAGTGLQMLKWLGTEDGKNLVDAVKGGRLKVKGAVLNAPQMMKLQALLAPDPD